MKKDMTILYPLGNNLYVNMTNRCPYNCTFCLRQTMDTVSKENPHSLWLEREPSVQEVCNEFKKFDMDQYNEIVFCGFGEPTERLYDIFEVCDCIKTTYNKPIRINTNGSANLIWQKDTTKDFKDRIDTVSISLNHPDPVQYQNIIRSKFGIQSHKAMLEFAKNVKQYVKHVCMTTVDTTISHEDEKQCALICKELGVSYRIRPYEK